MRIWYRLVTFSMTSPKHICSQSQKAFASRDRKHDELRSVTARVSHRPHSLYSHINECDPQGLRRPRFSFFRFNCQTASFVKQNNLPTRQHICAWHRNALSPAGLTGWF